MNSEPCIYMELSEYGAAQAVALAARTGVDDVTVLWSHTMTTYEQLLNLLDEGYTIYAEGENGDVVDIESTDSDSIVWN